MTPIIIEVPTLSGSVVHYDRMFALWGQLNGDGLEVTFHFPNCRFLAQNAVAFLGGLARLVQHRGGSVQFDWDSLDDNIRTNLAQQGFLATFGSPGGPWKGNSIPYREDQTRNVAELMDYLKSKWLGRGWISVSQKLRDAIVGRVWEIYANAFEHSHSSEGIFSCGQHYPKRKQLDLTVVDFGVGIPSNVRVFVHNTSLPAGRALEWAFQAGNTTKPNGMGRGMGLDLLRDFVRLNKGRLEVFSHDGYARIDEKEEKYETRSSTFEGTILNISLQCDDRHYCFVEEVPKTPLF